MAHRKTGVPSLMYIAKELCRLITKFTPIITQLYPSNVDLLAALAAANTACAALEAQLAVVREYEDS